MHGIFLRREVFKMFNKMSSKNIFFLTSFEGQILSLDVRPGYSGPETEYTESLVVGE